LAQRARKKRRRAQRPATAGGGGAADKPVSRDAMTRGYARSRERDDAIRAKLEPFAPGERPLVVTISAIVCALIAVANLGLYLAGWDVQGQEPKLPSTLALCAVLLAAAAGMWRMRYWAVLGFEMLLGIVMVYGALSLLVASNVQGALLAVAVVALSGLLFWKLIRVMARIKLPALY
jgi:hypothetical protein